MDKVTGAGNLSTDKVKGCADGKGLSVGDYLKWLALRKHRKEG